MRTLVTPLLSAMIFFGLATCGSGYEKTSSQSATSAFDDDVSFLKKYQEVIVLSDRQMKSRIAVVPALQARVMTSTAGPPENLSYGWINRTIFESGDTSIHMNAFGGEERFWLGPEGGQYALFFKKGDAFTFDNWRTPRLIDLDAYEVVSSTSDAATFTKTAELTNYAGAVFNVKINRKIKILEPADACRQLGLEEDPALISVAYQTSNAIENTGNVAWNKSSGLLSIWLLGMFNPSPTVTMVFPFREGSVESLGPVVNDDYFGKVPSERLKIGKGVIYFKGDGEFRSKIGLSPARAKDVMASYDQESKTLTILKYTKGEPADNYVNSSGKYNLNLLGVTC